MGYIRSQLAALFLAMAITPQAVAQCGPNIDLPAERWSLVGVPCEPPVDGNTIAEVFGPSLDLAAPPQGLPTQGAPNYNYGVTWMAWKKGYDSDTCPVEASDPNNCYVQLVATDTVRSGNAFWLYTTEEATLDFTAPDIGATVNTGFPPGSGWYPFYGTPSEFNNPPRYYLFANPWNATVNYADFRWTVVLDIDGVETPLDLSTEQAANQDTWSFITGYVYYWNGSAYDTRYWDFLTGPPSSAAASFEPKRSAWLEMQLGWTAVSSTFAAWVPAPPPAP
jgi:hypothetical protein